MKYRNNEHAYDDAYANLLHMYHLHNLMVYVIRLDIFELLSTNLKQQKLQNYDTVWSLFLDQR